MSLLHKVRLILAGILVSLGIAAVAQVGGGSGISAPPFDDSDVARLDARNVFTDKQHIEVAAAPLDQKRWGVEVLSNGCWRLVTNADGATAAASPAITLCRTGTAVDSVALTATSVTVNGVELPKFARGEVANTGSASVTKAAGVTSVSRASLGIVQVNYTAAGFTAEPVCVASAQGSDTTVSYSNQASTTIDFFAFDISSAALADRGFHFLCTGL